MPGCVVLPTDSVEEGHRVRSDCQHDLGILKMKFDPNKDSDSPVLDIENEWSLSQHRSILRELDPL
jgi:hypothetical protein